MLTRNFLGHWTLWLSQLGRMAGQMDSGGVRGESWDRPYGSMTAAGRALKVRMFCCFGLAVAVEHLALEALSILWRYCWNQPWPVIRQWHLPSVLSNHLQTSGATSRFHDVFFWVRLFRLPESDDRFPLLNFDGRFGGVGCTEEDCCTQSSPDPLRLGPRRHEGQQHLHFH